MRGTHKRSKRHAQRNRFIPACAGNSRARREHNRQTTVHPRVCGELGRGSFRGLPRDGSSPRVRGTPIGIRGVRVGHRFIPACAGNSRRPSGARIGRSGSSPRVRGTLGNRAGSHAARRFIPACAGNSGNAHDNPKRMPVHPRVCGELPSVRLRVINRVGSSPRVRGTQWRSSVRRPLSTVHPRVCGELLPNIASAVNLAGSSPRVRGTLPDHNSRGHLRRFIPACAGNSPELARRPRSRAVHPRVCGELGKVAANAASTSGSSPRVRGTPGVLAVVVGARTVHPRVCGELVVWIRPGGDHRGSSPRVRGTR